MRRTRARRPDGLPIAPPEHSQCTVVRVAGFPSSVCRTKRPNAIQQIFLVSVGGRIGGGEVSDKVIAHVLSVCSFFVLAGVRLSHRRVLFYNHPADQGRQRSQRPQGYSQPAGMSIQTNPMRNPGEFMHLSDTELDHHDHFLENRSLTMTEVRH